MILVRIIRFLRGYASFTCRGGFAERFINLCALNGIVLWDTKILSDGIRAKTYIKNLSHIGTAEQKSGMKIKLEEKHGLPVIIAPYLARKGLIAGAAAAVLIVIYLSQFLWTVSISGNVNYTAEQILDICRQNGVYQGARLDDIDVYRVRNDIGTASDDFSWFAVNIYGSGASVELTERLAKTEIYDKTTPCNIISGTDGEVVEIYSLSGAPQVKAGSAVKKGDLLISGVTERSDGSSDFVHARGHAVIRTSRNISASVMRRSDITLYTELTECFSVSIFGISIPLYSRSGTPCSFYTSTLTFRGTLLPVSITRLTFAKTVTKKAELSEKQALLLACRTSLMSEIEIMKSCKTEKKAITVEADSETVKISGSYINLEQTGEERFFEVSQEE